MYSDLKRPCGQPCLYFRDHRKNHRTASGRFIEEAAQIGFHLRLDAVPIRDLL